MIKLTKEQEEAIEKLKYIDRYYDCNNYYSRYDLDCIEIVLNLIQEQHVEIEIKQNRIQELEKALIDDNYKYREEMKKKDKKLRDIENHIKAELRMIDKCFNEVGWAGKEQYDGMRAAYKCLLNIYFENQAKMWIIAIFSYEKCDEVARKSNER